MSGSNSLQVPTTASQSGGSTIHRQTSANTGTNYPRVAKATFGLPIDTPTPNASVNPSNVGSRVTSKAPSKKPSRDGILSHEGSRKDSIATTVEPQAPSKDEKRFPFGKAERCWADLGSLGGRLHALNASVEEPGENSEEGSEEESEMDPEEDPKEKRVEGSVSDDEEESGDGLDGDELEI